MAEMSDLPKPLIRQIDISLRGKIRVGRLSSTLALPFGLIIDPGTHEVARWSLSNWEARRWVAFPGKERSGAEVWTLVRMPNRGI